MGFIGGTGESTDSDGNGPGSGQTEAPASPDAGCVTTLPNRRVWMLSRQEYDVTASAALETSTQMAEQTFSPELRENGYDSNANNSSVDSVEISAMLNAAESLAHTVAPAQRSALSCTPSTSPTTADQDSCIAGWLSSLGKRIYRRPLTAADLSSLYGLYVAGFTNPDPSVPGVQAGLELAIEGMLMSPSFLYRSELGDDSNTAATVPMTQYELAQALSYLTTGGPPDATLMGLADQGQLNGAALQSQATRLLATDAGTAQLATFALEWLGIDEVTGRATPDGPITPDIATRMLAESNDTVTRVLNQGSGTYRELMTTPTTELDSTLAAYYGLSTASLGATPSPVDVSGTRSLGLLGQGAFLAASVPAGLVAPLHRSDIIRTKLLCNPLPSFVSLGLPANFMPPPLAPQAPGQSLRDRLESMIPAGTACGNCHQFFMPLGFAFEGFDTFGRTRTNDNGAPIDTTGQWLTPLVTDASTGGIVDVEKVTSVDFTGASDLAQKIAASTQGQNCFAQNVFTFASGRNDLPANDCDLQALQGQFGGQGGTVRQAVIDYVTSPSFANRRRE
jgi:hypothetical protein